MNAGWEIVLLARLFLFPVPTTPPVGKKFWPMGLVVTLVQQLSSFSYVCVNVTSFPSAWEWERPRFLTHWQIRLCV